MHGSLVLNADVSSVPSSSFYSCLSFNMTRSLRLPADHTNIHRLSVTIDMKRTSPTFPDKKNVVEFTNAGRFAELLTLAGANSFFINTDEMEYGGTFEELKECTTAVKRTYKGSGCPPACIRKDLIIHPIQVHFCTFTHSSDVHIFTPHGLHRRCF